jgi:hypothetical protein
MTALVLAAARAYVIGRRWAVHAALRAGVSLEGNADGLPGDRVPQPHIAVTVGGGQQLAVRAERHPVQAAVGGS